MRIEEIRVIKAGIQSSIRNAFISFSEMTLSVVRIRFDHGGKTVDGYGFCSNGHWNKIHNHPRFSLHGRNGFAPPKGSFPKRK